MSKKHTYPKVYEILGNMPRFVVKTHYNHMMFEENTRKYNDLYKRGYHFAQKDTIRFIIKDLLKDHESVFPKHKAAIILAIEHYDKKIKLKEFLS